MNSKTVKLLKKFASTKKVSFANTKALWERTPPAQRASLRIAMENEVLPVYEYDGAVDASGKQVEDKDGNAV